MQNSNSPDRTQTIYDEMLTNSLSPVFRAKTDADRVAEMTNEQFARLRQSVIGFAEPTAAWEKIFKKTAPGLWEYWAAWKELQ